MVDEPFQEQKFGGAGVQLVVEVGEDAFVLDFASKGRVGEDDVDPVALLDAGVFAVEAVGVAAEAEFVLVDERVDDGQTAVDHPTGLQVFAAGEGLHKAMEEGDAMKSLEAMEAGKGAFAEHQLAVMDVGGKLGLSVRELEASFGA